MQCWSDLLQPLVQLSVAAVDNLSVYIVDTTVELAALLMAVAILMMAEKFTHFVKKKIFS